MGSERMGHVQQEAPANLFSGIDAQHVEEAEGFLRG